MMTTPEIADSDPRVVRMLDLARAGSELSAEDEVTLREFYEGVFEGEDWIVARLPEMTRPNLEDSGPIWTTGEAVASDRYRVNPDAILSLRRRGSQVSIQDGLPEPELTNRQLGQYFGVHEPVHCAQMQGVSDNGQHLVRMPTPEEMMVAYREWERHYLEGDTSIDGTYAVQPHEVEANKYTWAFFEEKFLNDGTPNPLSPYMQALGVDIDSLRHAMFPGDSTQGA